MIRIGVVTIVHAWRAVVMIHVTRIMTFVLLMMVVVVIVLVGHCRTGKCHGKRCKEDCFKFHGQDLCQIGDGTLYASVRANGWSFHCVDEFRRI
ncbi:hypothetical protein C7402_10297 [Paraburkholderia unamae]|uniref:Secreted protein n=1 Tax=Paraburkholderia unamae TaxID=219649 RepID=A0ABX5KT73_9BURK|nr:hypothetical protein C7402_10297 [Paraburkholderia unamae]RAR68191.1 hypothetical protein C7401_101430 [Paraburkholderia unamae]